MWKPRPLRIAARIGWIALGCALTIGFLQARRMQRMPELELWHRIVLEHELHAASKDAPRTFDAYVALERQLFAELRSRVIDTLDPATAALSVSRFNPRSPTFAPPDGLGRWNASVELAQEEPRGVAVLLHGLSDSPYSMRAVAESLQRAHYHVIVPRLPGHGTVPAALTRITRADWELVVRLALRRAQEIREASPRPIPLLVGGYSSGAALALEAALDAVAQREPGHEASAPLPVPDALLLISPALAVSRLAALAGIQLFFSRLPGLEKLAWESTSPEYDPFKYGSFPLAAAIEIRKLTKSVDRQIGRIAHGAADGRPAFPPVLSFLSVFDATVSVRAVVERLYARLPENGSELVVFDRNHIASVRAFLAPSVDQPLEELRLLQAPFDITIVTNRFTATPDVDICARRAGTTQEDRRPLGLAWPREVYSLAHVSVPFSPDDPYYGCPPVGERVTLGNLEPRGERGALVIPEDRFLRLRYNPFFALMESRIAELAAALDHGALPAGRTR